MATFAVRDNHRIQVKIRLKGINISQTFDDMPSAQAWADQTESEIKKNNVFIIAALSKDEMALVQRYRLAQQAH